jgi:SAM-dependent methyltransferase
VDMSASPGSPHSRAIAAGDDRTRAAGGHPSEVVWHDLECGSYRADLPLWRKLAGAINGPILDIGAGTGRVTLDLAGAGRQVTALELDPGLLNALRERAIGLDVETVCADARSFTLPTRDFGLCIVPMQTIQLLADPAERAALLGCALAHLRPGGIFACAIATELDPFEASAGSPGPSPETARVDDTLYVSQAVSVSVLAQSIEIVRERRIVPAADERSNDSHPIGAWAGERNVIELARVGASALEREGARVGFHPERALRIEPTDEHVGSAVVMLRA